MGNHIQGNGQLLVKHGNNLKESRKFSLRRGDVILVDLDGACGGEKKGVRPAVVLQNDSGNEYGATTIIAPITSQYDPDDIYPFEVEIPAEMGNLEKDSIVQLSQVRTISIDDRVKDIFKWLPDEKMEEIDHALKISLGLD